MSTPQLTTTSYAILGLLAVQPWSTYELTLQMDRSLGRLWPRARSKLYEEPKKLVAHGLATVRTEKVGRRQRKVYRITAAGRRALAGWLAEPGGGPELEFEGLLKVFFAEHGTRDDVLATLSSIRVWAQERNGGSLEVAQAYVAEEAEFQHRLAINMLSGRFLTQLYALVVEWSDWAAEVVDAWPDDPAGAVPDRREVEATLRLAEATRDRPAHPALAPAVDR